MCGTIGRAQRGGRAGVMWVLHPIPCLICACADAWSCRMLLTDAGRDPQVCHNASAMCLLTTTHRQAGTSLSPRSHTNHTLSSAHFPSQCSARAPRPCHAPRPVAAVRREGQGCIRGAGARWWVTWHISSHRDASGNMERGRGHVQEGRGGSGKGRACVMRSGQRGARLVWWWHIEKGRGACGV